MRKRAGQLFQLGLSIGKLLRIRDTDEFAKALDALLTEFDVLVGDPQPKRGNLFSRLRTFGEQQPGTDGSLGLLEVAHLPFELDFIEIMITLSDTLVVTYSKLMPARGVDCTEAHLECVQRLDAKIKKHIIHRVIKDIDVVAKGLLREQLQTLVVGEN
nr:hypothetical protein HK105_001337 [Polyrhizophydium stewartii]